MNRLLHIMQGDHSSSPVTLRAILPARKVGSLIGKQGATHRRIEHAFNVKLYLHNEEDDYGRLTSMAGRPENNARAWREVVFILFSLSGKWLKHGEKLGVPFLVPVGLASILQEGRQNSILAYIASSTSVGLALKRDVLPQTTEVILYISIANTEHSSLDAFEKAVRLLCDNFLLHRSEAISPRNIYYVPGCIQYPPLINLDEENEELDDLDNDTISTSDLPVMTSAYDPIPQVSNFGDFFSTNEELKGEWHNEFLSCNDDITNANKSYYHS